LDREKLKAVKRNTSGEQTVYGCLRDGDVPELEVLEPREKKRGDDINLGEIAGADTSDA
jgi:hypothetical protein